MTTIYWLCDKTQVVCGCFIGTLLEFEKAVIKKHGDNEHGARYMALIDSTYTLMEI